MEGESQSDLASQLEEMCPSPQPPSPSPMKISPRKKRQNENMKRKNESKKHHQSPPQKKKMELVIQYPFEHISHLFPSSLTITPSSPPRLADMVYSFIIISF